MSKANGKLTDTLDLIEDDDCDMSFEERFDRLSQDILASVHVNIRRLANKEKITAEDENLQKQMISQFDLYDKMFQKLKKSGRLGDVKPNENYSKQLLERIKKKKSSIAPIVQSMAPK